MTGRKTVVILSRGPRLAAMFRETARDLARDHRVVALIRSDEREIWRDTPGVTIVDMTAGMARAAAAHGGRLAERAREIERATNLPLYKAAGNYLLYRRFAREYWGDWHGLYDTEREMLEEYVGSHEVLSQIIAEYVPALIMHEALDFISTLMTLALAYRHGILNLGMVFAPGMESGTIFFYYGLTRENFISTYLLRHPGLISEDSRRAARARIAEARRDRPPPVSHVEARRSRLSESPWSRPGSLLTRLAETGLWRDPCFLLRRWMNWRWLGRHLHRDIHDGPFILYLMHLQPEASTLSQAPRWVDQERIVEQMAINAPQGLRIAVKENPQCYGWRGRRYFGPLAELANVDLYHPLADTQELLRRAEALVTITGTAGLEAILLGTRVAVLGRPAYAEFPGVKQLDAPEEIFAALTDPAWRAKNYESQLETFIAAYLNSVHALGAVEPGKKWPPPEICGPNLAAAMRRTLAIIDRHKLTPQDFDPGHPFVGPADAKDA